LESLSRPNGWLSGIPTGYNYLDSITGGLQKKELVIVGGRPGMGKTAFSLKLAMNACCPTLRQSHRDMPPSSVLFFSLENPSDMIKLRILSMLSGLDFSRLRWKKLGNANVSDLKNLINILRSIPIGIVDLDSLRPVDIKSYTLMYMEHLKMRGFPPLGLVVIDCLHLMKDDKKYGNLYEELSEITSFLKAMAKELDLVILCSSKMRQSCSEAGEIDDLYGSGTIGEVSDVVSFIFRKEVLQPGASRLEGKAELLVKKNRNGPTGVQYLHFIKKTLTFEP